MSYELFIRRRAQKQLGKLSTELFDRICDRIRELSQNPRLHGSRKLTTRAEGVRHTSPPRENHQGKDNLLLFPASKQKRPVDGPVRRRERLGGSLRYYYRAAA